MRWPVILPIAATAFALSQRRSGKTHRSFDQYVPTNGPSESSVAFGFTSVGSRWSSELESAVEYFDSTMKVVIDEYADAAENLGQLPVSTGANSAHRAA